MRMIDRWVKKANFNRTEREREREMVCVCVCLCVDEGVCAYVGVLLCLAGVDL